MKKDDPAEGYLTPVTITANIVTAPVTAATATTRTNFAVLHMLGAARFSRQVAEIEQQHLGQPFGGFWEDILRHSTACIFGAVASLEAYANELFFDRATAFPGYSSELLDKLWEEFEQKPVVEKFGFALLLRGSPAMDRGARPFQDVAALIDLRNALTHFKPEWASEAVRHRQVSERLKERFSPSPFLTDALIFPRAWATQGCTRWAVASSLAYAAQFEKGGGVARQIRAAVFKSPHPVITRNTGPICEYRGAA